MTNITRKYKKREYHGMTNTPEYRVWASMINRCNSPKDMNYHKYGAKGITVCERWQDSFVEFIRDMGMRPSSDLSLDRIDGAKGYYPENCRWADIVTQNVNKSPWRINKLGYKGVHRMKSKRLEKYIVYISFGGEKQIYIGAFDNLEYAANMYDQYAINLHGDTAITNFIYE